MTASKGRVVAVWKTSWLPPSETFIRNQMDALVRWHPQAVGIRRTRSLLSRDSDCVLFETASLRNDLARRALEKTGYSARLNRLIESVGPDVIQAHFGNGGMIIRRSAKKRGVPLVVTLHGTDVTAGPAQRGISGVYYRYRLRRLFRDATLLLPVSNFLASRTIELGADPAKVVVHHIGIPVRDDEIGSTVSREILAVGRLTEKKGFDHLLRAVALLPEDLKHIRVTIIGDGPLRESREVGARARCSRSFQWFQDKRRGQSSHEPEAASLPSFRSGSKRRSGGSANCGNGGCRRRMRDCRLSPFWDGRHRRERLQRDTRSRR
jgi:colanic acid/amylovoran biosynthesis glycosyltransferase